MKTLTVNELLAQLENMVKMGYGNSPVLYMDADSITHSFDTGVHDIWEIGINDDNTVILG